MTTETEMYERGRREGEVDARLKGHDEHFKKINGSIDRFADKMGELTLVVQRLSDEALAREAALAAKALAVKEAKENAWSPRQRIAVLCSAAAGMVIATIGVYSTVTGKGG